MKNDILNTLKNELAPLKEKLQILEQNISIAMREREKTAQDIRALMTTIDFLSKKNGTPQPITPSKDNLLFKKEMPNTAVAQQKTLPLMGEADEKHIDSFPIHNVAKLVLQKYPQGLTSSELVTKIEESGKKLNGQFKTTILSGALKRFPKIFQKRGTLWVLAP